MQQEQSLEQLSLSFTVLALLSFARCLGLLGPRNFFLQHNLLIREIGIRRVWSASVTSITLMLSKDFYRNLYLLPL